MRSNVPRLVVMATLIWSSALAGCLPTRNRAPDTESGPAEAGARVRNALAKLPLHFVENRGQLDPRVAYYVAGRDLSLFFTERGVTFALAGASGERWAVDLEFAGAAPEARPTGKDPTPATVNYLKGHEREWLTGIPTYAGLVYPNLWPGVDLVYAGGVDRLKYEFVVRPGADPNVIALAYRGATAVEVSDAGDLVVSTPVGPFRDDAPYAYQERDGRRVEVSMAYRLDGADGETHRYGFSVGAYDPTVPLVLDPGILVYAGLLGGSDYDHGLGIAVNAAGEAYVVGETSSTNFPVVNGTPDKTKSDAFVAKIRADGTSLVYSTYLGGNNFDNGFAIGVDADGRAYVTGRTLSSDFPTTANAWDKTCGTDGVCNTDKHDAFVAKLSSSGSSLLYSTFLGGSHDEVGYGIAVGASGTAYVTGSTFSSNFPAKATGFVFPFDSTLGGFHDAFVSKLDTLKSGTASLVYSTYLGGSGLDLGRAVAVNAAGEAYVTGFAGQASSDFPVKNQIQNNQPGTDAFATKLNKTGTGLIFSTFLGGNGDPEEGRGIALDSAGNAYVIGFTKSTNFITTAGAYDTTCGSDGTCNGGKQNVFVTKLTGGGGLVYSTYLGGSDGYHHGLAIAVDGLGNAYLTGVTLASDFPTTPGALDTTCGPAGACGGETDGFVTVLNAAGSKLLYSQYLGGSKSENNFGSGIAVGGVGVIYVTGATGSNDDFPVTANPWDKTYNGGTFDAFAVKLSIGADLAVSKQASVDSVMVGDNLQYKLNVANNGPSAASGVTLDDKITTKVDFEVLKVETAHPGASCTVLPNKNVHCDLGTLAAGAATTVILVITPTDLNGQPAGIITNEVAVAANEPDPDPGNNKAKVTTTVTDSD